MAVIRTSTATNSNKAYTNWPAGTFLARLSKIVASVNAKGVSQYKLYWRMISPADAGLDPKLKALFEAGEPHLVRAQREIASDPSLGNLFDNVSIVAEDYGHGPELHWTAKRLGGFIPTDNIEADPEHADFAAAKVYSDEFDESFDEALASVTELDEEEYRHTNLNALIPHLIGRLAVISTKLQNDKVRRNEDGSPVVWTNVAEYRMPEKWAVEEPVEYPPQTVPAGALAEVPTGAALESYA